MAKSLMRSFKLLAAFVILSVALFSCSSSKNIKYFQDIPDSGQLKTIPKASYFDPKIQPDDIITVIIQTIDPLSTGPINSGNLVGMQGSANAVQMGAGSTSSSLMSGLQSVVSGQQQTAQGYLVDKNGCIELPVLGKVTVEGMTTYALRDSLTRLASKYYQNPTVIVRFANFKVSVDGEVARPGTYVMPNERVSVLDAISMAGDLTIFGKRDNVLLIRENGDGTRTPYRINLNRTDFMSSPYFYLKQNDYIYVEPGKGKAAANDASQARTFAILGSLLSVLIVLASRITIK